MVVFIPCILHILEDGVKVSHSIPSEQSNVANESGNAARRKGTARESNKDNLVPLQVVGGNERIRFSDVL